MVNVKQLSARTCLSFFFPLTHTHTPAHPRTHTGTRRVRLRAYGAAICTLFLAELRVTNSCPTSWWLTLWAVIYPEVQNDPYVALFRGEITDSHYLDTCLKFRNSCTQQWFAQHNVDFLYILKLWTCDWSNRESHHPDTVVGVSCAAPWIIWCTVDGDA